MFLETTNNDRKRGWIEVIVGSMFSGKTEELIRRLRRAQFAKQKVEIFKPTVDTRYDEFKVVSHQGIEIHSTPVPSSANILLLANSTLSRLDMALIINFFINYLLIKNVGN